MKNIKVEEKIWKRLLELKYEWEQDKVSDVIRQIMGDRGELSE